MHLPITAGGAFAITACASKTSDLPTLAQSELAELAQWVEGHGDNLPSFVKIALEHYQVLAASFAGSDRKMRALLDQLRRAMGFIPSSERRKNSGDPIGATAKPNDPKPKDPRQRLLLTIARHKDLDAWHKKLAKKHRRKLKRLEKKAMEFDDDLTPEELAEAEAEHHAYLERLKKGDGPEVAMESAREAFVRGGAVNIERRSEVAQVSDDRLAGAEVVQRLFDQRTRHDFAVTRTIVTIDVEKVVMKTGDGTTTIASASVDHIGPAKMDVTWGFLANMAVMVASYAVPFNRLGTMLSDPDKRFTAASLSRKFQYIAKRLVPIYLQLFKDLSKTDVVAGDDTTPVNLEINRYKKDIANEADTSPPWLKYTTSEAAEASFKQDKDSGLGVLIARDLGFQSNRKDGNGAKTLLQTSVISGRGNPDDPRSSIVFYRSHIGSFGNLLTLLLKKRERKHKKIVVQSDLATTNPVTDPQLVDKFKITYAGCTSHARRPFALHEDDDPELTSAILHAFQGLYIYEKGLDLHGRNRENVLAVRRADSRQMWDDIKDYANLIAQKWPKTSELGEAARYIIRNFTKLTAYIENPRISISNDFSERMLRMENLIQSNAYFRRSLEGRFALDVIRTILQTATAAHVAPIDYLIHVMKTPSADLEKNPSAFTPFAYQEAHKQV